MASLTGLFKPEPVEIQDNDKLVDLFRNRAELKKEFAALREEKYQLQERIKAQEGATARVQQKMDHLESLLLDREWYQNVVVFYQFRRLSAHYNAKLARFSEQLKQQHEQRIHGKVLDEWRAKQASIIGDIESGIGDIRRQIQELEDQLQFERQKLATMNGFSKLFRGRKQESRINEITADIESRRTEEQQQLTSLTHARETDPPDHQGLDIATKRSINIMVLAFAQQLYLHVEEDGLAAMAKESSEKSVGAVNYGTKYECDTIMERIEQRWKTTVNATSCADVLQKRAKFLADRARFRSDDDVVPTSGTTSIVFAIDQNGVVKEKDANLLGENYFGIAKVLSR